MTYEIISLYCFSYKDFGRKIGKFSLCIYILDLLFYIIKNLNINLLNDRPYGA